VKRLSIGVIMTIPRSSGLFLHITSLPGKFGIGTLGNEAYEFVDLLEAGGQKYWQILPLNPVSSHFGFSPYSSSSTFAGNPLFINLEMVDKEEWMRDDILSGLPVSEKDDFVNFNKVLSFKMPFLRKAFENFQQFGNKDVKNYFNYFCQDQKNWLDDYALFIAISIYHDTYNWAKWDKEIVLRKPKAVKILNDKLQAEIIFQKFLQFIFLKQWFALKKYANKKGIKIIGDIPFYVNFDSCDTWSNPEIFHLEKKTYLPTKVAGVPPDYFSKTGQRWGNPIYRWFEGKKIKEATFQWWLKRIRHINNFVDVIRLDHFRGFESYWSIPAKEKTAQNGKWVKGPGALFFKMLEKQLKNLVLIAEDLGEITPEVEKLRDDLSLPGMKILQFAFDFNKKNSYLPHNYKHSDCVLYPGTHDNNTINGWFNSLDANENTRNYIVDYLDLTNWVEFHWQIIKLGLSTIADLTIFPVQDLLGYGEEYRMNTPGTIQGNWRWKLAPGKLTSDIMQRLRKLVELYGR